MGPFRPVVEVNVSVVVDGVEMHPHHRPKPKLHLSVGPVQEQKLSGPGDPVMASIQLTDTQQAPLSFTATDKKGFPAEVQNPTFSSGDPNVVSVSPDPGGDPTKSVIVAGAPGNTQVVVSADADLGDGVELITGSLDVTVVAGKAAVINVAAGAVSEQP